MNITDFNRIQESLEKQEVCKCCDRGQKVMFYCSVTSCPNHTKFPLYCILCNDDEPTKHEHRPKAIAIKGDSSKADWQQLRAKVSETLSKANAWHGTHGELVNIVSDEKYQGGGQLKREY
jgi:hypothetical protein